MIIEQQKYDSIVMGVEGKQVGIDTSRAEKLKYFFSQGIYSHPFESVVRELASNILDAYVHSEVDIKESPGVVRLTQDYISFQDFGVGMSEELFDEVYCQMLNSTKEQDADSIGAWGIGSKSPWAVSPQFYLSTVYNGVKRDYVLNKEAGNDKVYPIKVEETDLPNGTLVTVPINSGDLSKWIKACESQLAFFKYIVFECNEKVGYSNYSSKYWNEEPIIETSTFFFRDSFYSKMEHYCYVALEQVVYPIKWSDLGLSSSKCPIVFKCSTRDGLIPTLSRENLIINEHTKNLILSKIQKGLDELFSYVHKNEYLVDYLKNKNTARFNILDHSFTWDYNYISSLKESGKINIDVSFLLNPIYIRNGRPIDNLPYFWSLFDFKEVGKTRLVNARSSLSIFKPRIIKLDKKVPYALLKRDYLHSGVVSIPDLHLFRRGKRWDPESLYSILELKNTPRTEWRQICEQFVKDVEYYLSTIPSIPDSEIEKYKNEVRESQKQKRNLLKKGKTPQQRQKGAIYAGRYTQRKTKKIPLSVVDPYVINKKLNIYSTDESQRLDWIESLSNCLVWYVPSNHVSKLEGVPHWISLEDFYKSKKFKKHCYINELSNFLYTVRFTYTEFLNLPYNLKQFIKDNWKYSSFVYKHTIPTDILNQYIDLKDRYFVSMLKASYNSSIFDEYNLNYKKGLLRLKALLRENRILKSKLNQND